MDNPLSDAAWFTAWATATYVVLTFFVAVGALGAWRSARNQAEAAQRQLCEAQSNRKATLRPFMVFDEAVREGNSLILTFRNVGPGPALNIGTRTWISGFNQEPTSVEELGRAHEAALNVVKNQEPVAITISGAVAAGESIRKPTTGIAFPPASTFLATTWFDYEDVFGGHFPEKGSWAGGTIKIS